MWAKFADLWSRNNAMLRWYRPWSRELHFWAIQHVAGPSPVAFRLVGLVLWVAILFLYREFLRTFLSSNDCLLATVAVASLAIWGTPLLWISGSQDLWMLALGFAFLLLVAKRHDLAALPLFVLALLSKETAAVFCLLALAYMILVAGDGWGK